MLNTSLLPIKTARRRSHGGTAWVGETNLKQPQDGAADFRARVASITSRLQPAMPGESEDARLTGATRSLFRRLLGLNVYKAAEKAKPATAVTVRKPSLAILQAVDQVRVA